MRALPGHPETAVSSGSAGSGGGAHARHKTTPVHHAARRRRGVVARGAGARSAHRIIARIEIGLASHGGGRPPVTRFRMSSSALIVLRALLNAIFLLPFLAAQNPGCEHVGQALRFCLSDLVIIKDAPARTSTARKLGLDLGEQ